MADLAYLSSRMKTIKKSLPVKVNEIAKDVSTAVIKELVAEMPVDTSKAVSNWVIGLGRVNLINAAPHVPGLAGSTRGASSAQTLAIAAILIRAKKPGIELHISNAVPYIRKIDSSSSSPGFKNKGLQAGEQALKLARLKL